MKREPKIVRCKVCKEETTHATTSSFYGTVHRWGPTTHKFVPDRKVGPARTVGVKP